jgi:tRNA U34 5-methylaminomethyl-2-thiouridine-forming methyltransferase MnmC
MKNIHPSLTWREDKIPVSTHFDDPYYSLDNGLAETRHVFLDGNNLPVRFVDGLQIAELGFGTGLNFIATLDQWRKNNIKGKFHFTSFEAYPMTPVDMEKAYEQFPDIQHIAAEIVPQLEQLRDTGNLSLPDAHLHLIKGDARETVSHWNGQADCWYLDGFSPAKNPELWECNLMVAVYEKTRSGGTAATYTAAGFVRRNLMEAGFDVERVKGFGRKRHMSVARKA